MVEIPKPMYLLGFYTFHDHPTCTVRAYLQCSNCYILPLWFIIVLVTLPVSYIGMTWILVTYMDVHKGQMRALNL